MYVHTIHKFNFFTTLLPRFLKLFFPDIIIMGLAVPKMYKRTLFVNTDMHQQI